MFPEHLNLTEEAEARLTALGEHQDLGSGMRIAMRDLEIRGAGSLLGAEQSGNMSAVGFDLFAQMLAQAVNATREGDARAMDALPPALSDITVNVPGHTYLPEEYVPDADERVLWYRRIASAGTVDDVDALREDWRRSAPTYRRPRRTCSTRPASRRSRTSTISGPCRWRAASWWWSPSTCRATG